MIWITCWSWPSIPSSICPGSKIMKRQVITESTMKLVNEKERLQADGNTYGSCKWGQKSRDFFAALHEKSSWKDKVGKIKVDAFLELWFANDWALAYYSPELNRIENAMSTDMEVILQKVVLHHEQHKDCPLFSTWTTIWPIQPLMQQSRVNSFLYTGTLNI